VKVQEQVLPGLVTPAGRRVLKKRLSKQNLRTSKKKRSRTFFSDTPDQPGVKKVYNRGIVFTLSR
jgi:hypothetical protein